TLPSDLPFHGYLISDSSSLYRTVVAPSFSELTDLKLFDLSATMSTIPPPAVVKLQNERR
ncbi:hypothetical protein Tco_0614233, partial [Tanacetum coccineum]